MPAPHDPDAFLEYLLQRYSLGRWIGPGVDLAERELRLHVVPGLRRFTGGEALDRRDGFQAAVHGSLVAVPKSEARAQIARSAAAGRAMVILGWPVEDLQASLEGVISPGAPDVEPPDAMRPMIVQAAARAGKGTCTHGSYLLVLSSGSWRWLKAGSGDPAAPCRCWDTEPRPGELLN